MRRPGPRAHCTILFLVLPALLLGACATRRLARPAREASVGTALPETWTHGQTAASGPVLGDWLRAFGDARLEALVREAFAGNRNVRALAARIEASRESTRIASAARRPSLGAGLGGTHGETANRPPGGSLGSFQDFDDFRLSLGASWEIDLWGRLARLRRAAEWDLAGDEADLRAARLSLAAGVAKAWFNVVAARLQVELADQTRDSFERNHRIVERNYKAGDVAASPLDVQFARNQVASAQRGLIAQRLAFDESRRSLELLLGRYPATSVEGPADLPELPGTVPGGIPSEVLLRRPDLAGAAADLLASAERADAARRNLLPGLTLTAGGSSGVASLELLDLVAHPAQIAASVGASLAQPIYRGGALRAQARQALALNRSAVESFANLALRAFREVESALATEASLSGQFRWLETEVRQANLAEAQATRDYSEGIVGYLSVLEAQRRAFSARSAIISLRNARLQTRVDLHLALGGDALAPEPAPAPAPSAPDRHSP